MRIGFNTIFLTKHAKYLFTFTQNKYVKHPD